ncbi:hypothetical protein [Mycolicibacterium houstonense]|uniref:hypothetical protein n=1 Tax=Mycolicibacterium houstonense TaxID=146021 RepID=UPI003F95BCE1
MDGAVRPWFATGVAMVGAAAVAIAPSWPAPDAQVAPPKVVPEFQLTDFELPYILTLPIVRQSIRNWAENWAVYLAGLAQAGIGLGQSVLAIPGVTVEIIQEIFARDFVGAFDTFTSAARDAVVAVGQPLLDSAIWRNQKYLVVEAALQAAWPQAVIDVANGFLDAGSGVATAFIQGTQNLIAAVLTFNLSNIVDATVEGTRNFLISLGDGARSVVEGIEAAQLGIATALATAPPPPPDFGTSELRTPSVERPLGVDATLKTVTLDVPAATAVPEPPPTKMLAEEQVSPVVARAVAPMPKKRIGQPARDVAEQVGADVKSFADRVTADVKKRIGVKPEGTKAHTKSEDNNTPAAAKPSAGGSKRSDA